MRDTVAGMAQQRYSREVIRSLNAWQVLQKDATVCRAHQQIQRCSLLPCFDRSFSQSDSLTSHSLAKADMQAKHESQAKQLLVWHAPLHLRCVSNS